MGAVAAFAKERLGFGIALQEAGAVGAAVDAEVEGIGAVVAAGEQDLGAVPHEVLFGAVQEFLADAAAVVRGANAEHADDALLGPVARIDDGGMGKTDAAVVFLGEDQAGGIEVRLGE